MDTLFMNIMNCIALHLDIIQGAFLTVKDRAREWEKREMWPAQSLYNTEVSTYALNYEMEKVYRHLQTVYRLDLP